MLYNFFFDINSERIVHRLVALRRQRNDADYALDINLTKEEARKSIRDAKNLAGNMNRINPQT